MNYDRFVDYILMLDTIVYLGHDHVGAALYCKERSIPLSSSSCQLEAFVSLIVNLIISSMSCHVMCDCIQQFRFSDLSIEIVSFMVVQLQYRDCQFHGCAIACSFIARRRRV